MCVACLHAENTVELISFKFISLCECGGDIGDDRYGFGNDRGLMISTWCWWVNDIEMWVEFGDDRVLMIDRFIHD